MGANPPVIDAHNSDTKRISSRVLRHTTALEQFQAGVAIWAPPSTSRSDGIWVAEG